MTTKPLCRARESSVLLERQLLSIAAVIPYLWQGARQSKTGICTAKRLAVQIQHVQYILSLPPPPEVSTQARHKPYDALTYSPTRLALLNHAS